MSRMSEKVGAARRNAGCRRPKQATAIPHLRPALQTPSAPRLPVASAPTPSPASSQVNLAAATRRKRGAMLFRARRPALGGASRLSRRTSASAPAEEGKRGGTGSSVAAAVAWSGRPIQRHLRHCCRRRRHCCRWHCAAAIRRCLQACNTAQHRESKPHVSSRPFAHNRRA